MVSCSDYSVIERWEDGSVKTKSFKDGNQVCFEYYNSDQVLFEKGCFLGDEKNGKWTTFYNNGNVKTISHYQHGNLGGDYKRFSENGKLLEEKLYIDGFEENEMKAFDNQSYQQPEYEVVNGVHKEFFENGNPKSVGKMRDGVKIGIWKYFYQKGSVWAKGRYLPKVTNHKTKIEKGDNFDVNLLLEDKYIKTGKWKFYNPQKELIREVIYRFVNNTYTYKVVFEQGNKEL